MALYNYDKLFKVKGPGTVVSSYVQEAKNGTIDTNTIQRIICVYTNNLNACGFREITHGSKLRPVKAIINETQYTELVALVNPA